MLFVIIIIIAVSLLIYFAYFNKNREEFADLEPELRDVKNEASSVVAVLKDKSSAVGGKGRGRNLVNLAVFDCEDGEEREFFVNRQIFEEIDIGERDTLIYSGNIFLGFGERGATETISDEISEIDGGDDFCYDDFDENIDVEQSMEIPGETALTSEDAEALKKFRVKVKLPAKSETIEDETDSLTGYQARELLKKTTLYPFLRWESDVLVLFERTFQDAVSDMLGYASATRKGMAADSVSINKSEIRAVITVEERPPFKSKITAGFGVND